MSSSQESYAYLADGRLIYYFEEGAGPPFLYVHGGAGDAEGARPMFEVLRNRFRCIALDRVGYHRSGALDRVTTLEEQVEGIAAVHNACTSDPAWIIGHSGGGNHAIAYAVTHPNQVRGLVLMEPALYAVFPAGSRPPSVAAMIETVAPLFRTEHLHEAIAQFIGLHDPEPSQEALDEYAAGALSSDSRIGWESLAREIPLVVSWCPTRSEWAQLTQPALVMEGDHTADVMRAVSAKVAELLPNGELVTLKGLDHGAPWTAPDIVAQWTIEFIDRIVAAESEEDSMM